MYVSFITFMSAGGNSARSWVVNFGTVLCFTPTVYGSTQLPGMSSQSMSSKVGSISNLFCIEMPNVCNGAQ